MSPLFIDGKTVNFKYMITIKNSLQKPWGILPGESSDEVEAFVRANTTGIPWGKRVTLRVIPTIEEVTEHG